MVELAKDAFKLVEDPEQLIEKREVQEISGALFDILYNGLNDAGPGDQLQDVFEGIWNNNRIEDVFYNIKHISIETFAWFYLYVKDCPWTVQQWQLVIDALQCIADNDEYAETREYAADVVSMLEPSLKRRRTLRSWAEKI